jgi:Na+:H+ antiporter
MKRASILQIVLAAIGPCLLLAGLLLTGLAISDEIGELTLGLAAVLAVALFAGHLAVRLGQPAALGELVAGVLMGNIPGLHVFRSFGTNRYLDILAQVGMLLLLFEVGLGLSVRDLFGVGASSFLVALLGSAASVVIGTAVATALLPTAPVAAHVFLGAALAATSVGVTARVLRDMNASRHQEAKVILGAAVVDDVLALVLLGAITAWVAPSNSGTPAVVSVISLVMKTAGFLVFAVAMGTWLTPRWFRQAAKLETRGALLAAGLCFCFVLSWAATTIGLAALVVALGMLPRGEVTLVFAARSSTLRVGDVPLLDERGYIGLVTVVVLTTLLTPPALRWSLRSRSGTTAFTRPAA